MTTPRTTSPNHTRRALCGTLWAAPLAALLAGCAAAPPSAPADPVAGLWLMQRGVMAGEELPGVTREGLLLVLQNGRYSLRTDRGEYKLVQDGPHAGMDLHFYIGTPQERRVKAIWRRDGDRLTIAYDLSGKGRPAAFESPRDSQVMLAEFRRFVPPAPQPAASAASAPA